MPRMMIMGARRSGTIDPLPSGADLVSRSVTVLTACPSCGSALLQPLRSRPGDAGEMVGRAAVPRVPRVAAGVLLARSSWPSSTSGRRRTRELMVDAYERSVAESMEALADCLAAALELDLVGADDFAPRRAA